MATLLNLQTGEKAYLTTQHIIGRHPASANTVLNSLDASRVHATISWDGERWSLQDTSTNGTYINGSPVLRHNDVILQKDDKINFANPAADTWQMLDLNPPCSLLLPETPDTPVIVLEDIAVLPNESSPEVTLYLSCQGHWICESQFGICVLSDGDRVGTSNQIWRFVEAKICAETLHIRAQPISVPSEIQVYFEVSQNEEHVILKLKMNEHEFDLGERNHHYLLLLLARQRLADKTANISTAEQGWIAKEQLGQQLGLSETHINIQIYRFRKQIIKALPSSLILPQVIERRNGEIRFVYDNVQISGGIGVSPATDESDQLAV